MAVSTVSSMIAAVRQHLGDPDGKRWTTPVLVSYLSYAQRRISEVIGKIGESGWFESTASLSFALGTDNAPLPADFGGVKIVEWIKPNNEIVVLDALQRREQPYGRGAPVPGVIQQVPGYYIQRSQGVATTSLLYVLPANEGRTIRLTYRQMVPSLPTDGTGNMFVDSIFDEAISLRAAMKANGDAETSDTDWARELQSLIHAHVSAEQGSEKESDTEQVMNALQSTYEGPGSPYA